jgi:hypothetical protein
MTKGNYRGVRDPNLRAQAVSERQAQRAKLTPEEQLTALDWRLGKGAGARKERARLAQQIAERRRRPGDHRAA